MKKAVSRSRTVIFTGAGASAAFGYPLTKDLLPNIRKALRAGDAFEGIEPAAKKNQDLRRFLSEMLPGFETVKPGQLPLITDVLSLVDISLREGTALLPRRSQQEIAYFRRLLEEAIFHDIYEDYDSPAQARKYIRLVQRFASGILRLARRRNEELTLISTNYDLPVEQWLFDAHEGSYPRIARAFDFGMAWRSEYDQYYSRPSTPIIRLYKLHGSLNWLQCELCGYVYVNVNGSIVHQAYDADVQKGNECICGHAPLRSVLVTPSFVRDIRDVSLLGVWKSALEALRLSDKWIIIGYSFPAEDIAIRSLFLRALNGRDGGKPPAIRVILRGNSPAVSARYKLFFPDAEFDYRGMKAFIDELSSQGKSRRPSRRRKRA